MASGIGIPIKANPGGGMRQASGNEQDTNVLMLALASDDNENGFQQGGGLGSAMIFDISDPQARADILASLRRVFARFERLKRFKLLENTIRWIDDETKPGETVLACKYIALETDRVEDFAKNYYAAGSGVGGDTATNVR
jgi:hypothetical protein